MKYTVKQASSIAACAMFEDESVLYLHKSWKDGGWNMRGRIGGIAAAVIAVSVLGGTVHATAARAEAVGQESVSGAEKAYRDSAPAVFYLKAYRKDGTLKTVGSGFLTSTGKALTAAHVVEDGVRFEAVFDDGAVRKVNVLKSDEEADVALLSVANTGKRTTLALTDEKSPARYGQRSFAIGYPLKDGKIITEGIVNAPKAEVNGEIRLLTSAQVSSGMSGGPLLGEDGRVIGLISGSFRTMSGIHICVTAEEIRNLLKTWKA